MRRNNIFNNVAKRGSKYIYLQDLMNFMREDEAIKTINLFEGAKETKTKRVSKKASQELGGECI